MNKCAACGKFQGAKGGATCSVCSKKYHIACLGMSEATRLNSDWQCPDCKRKVPKGDNTPVRAACNDNYDIVSLNSQTLNTISDLGDPTSTSKVDVGQEIRLFRDELRQLREEFKEFREEMTVLRESVMTYNLRVDHLESRIGVLEQRATATIDCDSQRSLEQTIVELKRELNDRDQDALCSDLEISNLPEEKGENIVHTVGLIAVKLGITLVEDRDIVFAERVGAISDASEGDAGRTAARGRRVVVRLARRTLRDDLLRAARVRRETTSSDLGIAAPPRRFYLNERLTRGNKQLFYKTRLTRRFGWKYAWTKRGRIFVRQADGQPACPVRTIEDLSRVFGEITVGMS